MRVRKLDANGEWLFGRGRNDYLTGNAAVAQNIKTRLEQFLGDCFFDLGAGIDWFNRLGSKDQLRLRLEISAIILNTEFVTGLLALSTFLDPKTRRLSISWTVQTEYSTVSGNFKFNQDQVV